MVLLVIYGSLAFIAITAWLYCRKEEDFEKSFRIYVAGKISLILLVVIFGASKGLNFFLYNQEIREIQIEQIARFSDGGKNKILAVVEVDGESLAFEISKNSDLEVGDKLKISRKSSKFPVYDNWSEDWKPQK